ncbi:Maleylacetate reductase [Grifola frondosa]|uniref:Maleylacetate reductase n=1 Tax=Grifola frondosa TaxID=5627 RepID=A0A1C7LQT3_GRIFR|nr:Maleylacetate reductase [Grifola frondosa]
MSQCRLFKKCEHNGRSGCRTEGVIDVDIAQTSNLTSYESTSLQGFYSWTDTLKTDVVKKVEAILREHNAYGATFYEIGQHAPVAGIRNGLKLFKEVGADVIVAVGGGSPVDASKAILYFQQQETGGPYLRQIAIPTTLSAAEYTIGAGYTNDEGMKVAVSSQELAPAGIILDAELTLSTPERLWLSTGLRAVDHAVENLSLQIFATVEGEPQRRRRPPEITDRLLDESLAAQTREVQCPRSISCSRTQVGRKVQHPSWYHFVSHSRAGCALKAEVASQEDKEWLAGALFHLRQPSTGSLDGDILKLSADIDQLVLDLGLKSTLVQYNVPTEDFPKIAEQAVGSKDDPTFPKVVKLLEALYQ